MTARGQHMPPSETSPETVPGTMPVRLPSDLSRSRPLIVVVTAGLSRPSSTAALAGELADATVTALSDRGVAADVSTIELRPYAKALADAMVDRADHGVTPDAVPSSSAAAPTSYSLEQVIDEVTGADGLIAVTPTFAASYAGLFKSFFDVLDPDALTGMPVLLGATGGSARHSLVIEYAMRPLLTYFRTRIVPTGVFAAAEDADGGVLAQRLTQRVQRAGTELARLVAGSRQGREAVTSP